MKKTEIGPDLDKRELREKMSPEHAKKELDVIMNLIDLQKEYEDKAKNVDVLLHNLIQLYGCTDLNHLLSTLQVRGGGKILTGMRVKDVKK